VKDEQCSQSETLQIFLNLPLEVTLQERISSFIEGSNNKNMAIATCTACMREVIELDTIELALNEIPNPQKLRPGTSHPAHILTDDMLLEMQAIQFGRCCLCVECEKFLMNDETPPLSLAKNMWIGDIPWELKMLTLPERLLIAKYYLVAYVIKLFPKKKNAFAWLTEMQKGIRGNVSTYRLDHGQIVGLVGRPELPPPAELLSSTIGVTFVGPKDIPSKQLLGMFRVRRGRVQKAIEWLIAHNLLYATSVISEENLNQLPLNGIPDEIALNA
jgi:hypothetical protein